MKTISERIELIKNHQNVLELVNQVTVEDPLQNSHYKDKRKAIWWYHPGARKLLFSTDATSHMQHGKFPEVNNFSSWKRGRVYQDGGRNIIMMYSDDFPNGRVPGDVVHDVYNQISNQYNEPISDFVDQDGYSLIGE